MGEETTYLENEIRRERAELAGSIQALEAKAARAGDWRYQFAKRPAAVLGAAFVGGLLLARVVTNGNAESNGDWRDESDDLRFGGTEAARLHARETRKTGLLNGFQAALVSVVAHEVKDYFRSRMSGGVASGG